MGGRLTTPPSSASSSSTTAHRTTTSGSTTNLAHSRTHSNTATHLYQQSAGHHRHRSSSGGHQQQHPHGVLNAHSSRHSRHRATSANLEPMGTTAFNLNLLRYVGLEHDSDDQSSDDDSPQTHRRFQHFLLALRDVACPVCNKTVPSDSFDKHILQCLSKPRIDYNGLSPFTFNCEPLFFVLL